MNKGRIALYTLLETLDYKQNIGKATNILKRYGANKKFVSQAKRDKAMKVAGRIRKRAGIIKNAGNGTAQEKIKALNSSVGYNKLQTDAVKAPSKHSMIDKAKGAISKLSPETKGMLKTGAKIGVGAGAAYLAYKGVKSLFGKKKRAPQASTAGAYRNNLGDINMSESLTTDRAYALLEGAIRGDNVYRALGERLAKLKHLSFAEKNAKKRAEYIRKYKSTKNTMTKHFMSMRGVKDKFSSAEARKRTGNLMYKGMDAFKSGAHINDKIGLDATSGVGHFFAKHGTKLGIGAGLVGATGLGYAAYKHYKNKQRRSFQYPQQRQPIHPQDFNGQMLNKNAWRD